MSCLNCRITLVGAFCHGCGQAAKTKRFTFRAILHELPHAILHLEHALPRTVVALLRRPGHTIREYLGGKRVHTYSPFALLFLVAGLLGLAMVTFKINRFGSIGVQSDSELSTKITAAMFKYHAWVRLALLPLNAIGPTLVLRRRTGLMYGEQVVAAAMVTTGSLMLSLVAVPIKFATSKTGAGPIVSSAAELTTTLYTLWAYAQLQNDGRQRDGVWRWIRSAGSMIAALGVYVLVIVAGSTVVVLGALLGKKLHLL